MHAPAHAASTAPARATHDHAFADTPVGTAATANARPDDTSATSLRDVTTTAAAVADSKTPRTPTRRRGQPRTANAARARTTIAVPIAGSEPATSRPVTSACTRAP